MSATVTREQVQTAVYDALAELGPERERRAAESPFGRIGTPEDVAAAVLFLASAHAEFASGSVIDVNGASFLRM